MRGTHGKTQEEANDRIEKTPPESIAKNGTIDILREAVQGLKGPRHDATIAVNVLFAVASPAVKQGCRMTSVNGRVAGHPKIRKCFSVHAQQQASGQYKADTLQSLQIIGLDLHLKNQPSRRCCGLVETAASDVDLTYSPGIPVPLISFFDLLITL